MLEMYNKIKRQIFREQLLELSGSHLHWAAGTHDVFACLPLPEVGWCNQQKKNPWEASSNHENSLTKSVNMHKDQTFPPHIVLSPTCVELLFENAKPSDPTGDGALITCQRKQWKTADMIMCDDRR